MKTTISILSAGLVMFAIFSCNKDESSSNTADDASITTEISVAATDSTPTEDSVIFEHRCGAHITRDSIAETALPAAVNEYLSANYAGYTFHKAFTETDTTGSINAYIVIIYYDDKPVGLKFDGEGVFVEVLRQRSKHHRH